MDQRSRRIKARFEWPLIVAGILVIPTIALEQSAVAEPWGTFAAVLIHNGVLRVTVIARGRAAHVRRVLVA